MQRNVGVIDKALRVILGIGALSMPFVLEGGARWLGLVGLVPLGTALLGTCPLYSILGVSTCSATAKPGHA